MKIYFIGLLFINLYFEFNICQATKDVEFAKTSKSDEVENQVIKDAQSVCPDKCRCPSFNKIDCSQAQLKTIPQFISNETIYLLLNENRLTTVSSTCFASCPKLKTLNLQDNHLSDHGVDQLAFDPLVELSDLQLANNKLRFIPNRLPYSLKTLHLSGNAISKIGQNSLAGQKQLKSLFLEDNALISANIHDAAFTDMTDLEEINLSNNFLQDLPWLPNSVQLINMNNNNLIKIRGIKLRRKRNVRGLFLQQNNLTDGVIANSPLRLLSGLELLDLAENRLTKIPPNLPKRLMRLHLEKNSIDSISTHNLKYLKKLEYLIIHENLLNNSGIENGSLDALKNLKVLFIYLNQLSEVPALPPNLETAVLRSNRIQFIPHGRIRRAIKLAKLDLRYNSIENAGIERGAFRPLPNLKTIDLIGNKLTAVPSLSRNVEEVLLGENKIIRIPSKAIKRLPYLRHLALNQNLLRDEGIPPFVFKENFSLKVLDLSSNKLQTIPRFLPPNVEYIYIQENLIEGISPNAFASAPHLKGIFLKNNLLLPETTPLTAFNSLRFLQIVDLSWRKPSQAVSDRKRRHALKKICSRKSKSPTYSRACSKIRVTFQDH